MIVRKTKRKADIDIKVVINGVSYYLKELPFEATIPSEFFKKTNPVAELFKWLEENANGVWYVLFDKKVVKFKLEDDAILLKLTFG